MKFLKNTFIFFVAIGAIGYSGYSFYQYSLGPCDKPLEYSIGIFDSQFGISKKDFKKYIAEAGMVWEKALNRNILIYNPKAAFKINLIYDQRQLITMQKQKTEFGLSSIEIVFKKLDTKFNTFKNKYDKRVSLYKQALTLFKNRKSTYNAKVAFWNAKGGAPKEKYRSLEKEKQYLNAEAIKLNTEISSINIQTKQLNSLLQQRNIKAFEYNKVAKSYNQKYNHGLEFNQAEYTGKGINVYQFSNKKNLILALAHEFGHALGMNHVENPKSIMYYITETNSQISPVPSAEDLAELKQVCKI